MTNTPSLVSLSTSPEERMDLAVRQGRLAATEDVFKTPYSAGTPLYNDFFCEGFVDTAAKQDSLPAGTPMYLSGRVACLKGKTITDAPVGELSEGRWVSGWIAEKERQERKVATAEAEASQLACQSMSQEELREEASMYQHDNHSPGEPGYCEPHEADWAYQADYPVANLVPVMNDKVGWACWFDMEIANFKADGMTERANMYLSIVHETLREPIVILERDGAVYIWDGYHRAGAMIGAGRATIPVIIGKPHQGASS